MKLDDKEQFVWDIYYAQIAGFQFHPRNVQKETRSVDEMLEDSADIVDKMIKIRRERCL